MTKKDNRPPHIANMIIDAALLTALLVALAWLVFR